MINVLENGQYKIPPYFGTKNQTGKISVLENGSSASTDDLAPLISNFLSIEFRGVLVPICNAAIPLTRN